MNGSVCLGGAGGRGGRKEEWSCKAFCNLKREVQVCRQRTQRKDFRPAPKFLFVWTFCKQMWSLQHSRRWWMGTAEDSKWFRSQQLFWRKDLGIKEKVWDWLFNRFRYRLAEISKRTRHRLWEPMPKEIPSAVSPGSTLSGSLGRAWGVFNTCREIFQGLANSAGSC